MILLRNAMLVDGVEDRPVGPVDLMVAEGGIAEVSERGLDGGGARTIDVGRRTLMPGLIDAHVHVIATTPSLGLNATLPDSLVALRAAEYQPRALPRAVLD